MAKQPTHISPFGVAIYPHLNTPDGKFDPENPAYSVKLGLPLDAADTQEFLAKLDLEHDFAVTVARKENGGKDITVSAKPYEINTEENQAVIKFKLKSKGKSNRTGEAWTNRLAIFGPAKQPLSETEIVGGGSKIRVAFFISNYYTAMIGAGISLRMKSVQVTELVVPGGHCDFDEAEGSYQPQEAMAAAVEEDESGEY
jgi:hypothetical protein